MCELREPTSLGRAILPSPRLHSMEQQACACPRCSRAISPGDTILFGTRVLSHLDCQQPRLLSAEERALLFTYCRDHPVGKCIACAGDFKLAELGLDVLGFLRYLCPRCRRDLTDSVRTHLYGCAMLPAEVRGMAQAVREAARTLVKETRLLRDASDVLLREAEATLASLREAMRQSLRPGKV